MDPSGQVEPASHGASQAPPPAGVLPAGQTWAQTWSMVSTQVPQQAPRWPFAATHGEFGGAVAQSRGGVVQVPPMQSGPFPPAMHCTPQPPQFAGSVLVSTQVDSPQHAPAESCVSAQESCMPCAPHDIQTHTAPAGSQPIPSGQLPAVPAVHGGLHAELPPSTSMQLDPDGQAWPQ